MGEQVGVWGWDAANFNYVKVLVDSLGHLQVDTLTSALPTGAATSAKQDTIIGHIDGLEALLAGGLPSILDTDSLKVIEQGTPSVHLYGYDSSDWQTLLVESSALKNLRVKLYDGADGINAQDMDNTILTRTGKHGLMTGSQIYLFYGSTTSYNWANCRAVPDGTVGSYTAPVGIYGFNGSMWDRLRVGALSDAFANPSYALVAGAFLMGWDSGNSQWERIKISAAGSIMTKEETSFPVSSGPITTSRLLYSGSADAFAVTVNKDAVAAVVVQLIDGSGPGDPVKWEVRVVGLEPFAKQFRPWLLFPNGLYINIVGSPYSVIVEYGG